jgi:hypothetical protein
MADELKQVTEQIKKELGEYNDLIKGKANQAEMETAMKELQGKIDEVKSFGGEKGLKDTIDLMLDGYKSLETELKNMKEKGVGKLKEIREVVEEQVTAETLKGYKEKGGQLILNLKDITNSDASGNRDFTLPGVDFAPNKILYYPTLLSQGVVPQGNDVVAWWERTTDTDNAAMVAEGGTIPQSEAGWTKATTPIRKLGDSFKVSREALEDTDFIRGEIMTLLNENIPNLLNTQLLSGDGTGQNLTGLLTYGKAFAKLAGYDTLAASSATNYDVLSAAITQVLMGQSSGATDKKAGFKANAIFLNPQDWHNMIVLKDGDGNYLQNPYISIVGGNVFFMGVRMYADIAIAAGTFLVGDLNQGRWYSKRAFEILFADQHSTDFIEDLITVKATQRVALRVTTAGAYGFVDGTFAAARTALETA